MPSGSRDIIDEAGRNTDFRDGNSIPFTQYIRPHGRPVARWIEVGADGIAREVVAKAREIVAAGFFLEMEELETSPRQVSFTIGDDAGDYAFELCVNGPDVPQTVRRLIIEADIEKLTAARTQAVEEAA